MTMSLLLLILAFLALAAFVAGRARSRAVAVATNGKTHSRPVYYGVFVALSALIPAITLLVVWSLASPAIINSSMRSQLPQDLQVDAATQSLNFGTVTTLAEGFVRISEADRAAANSGAMKWADLLAARGIPVAGDIRPELISAAETMSRMTATSRMAMTIAVLVVGAIGAALGYRRIAPAFRARNHIETVILVALAASSTIAILTTVGIVVSMLSEALRFFAVVPMQEFFFGTVWDPRFAAAGSGGASGQFGLIPLLAGTLYIAFVAMLFAVPVGLLSAIYMAEYATPRFRSLAKPALELLAGIPTIVYGFFALVTVGPFLRDMSAELNGLVTGSYTNFIQAQSVLTAGIVMGIMLIPFVSSLSDDIITQVPRALRDGSLGLGATRSETIKRVILPAALPGIVSALLLTASRAVGETMIVVLAAGVAARLNLSPFEPMTTVTVKIVNQLTGDLEFTSPQTLVAFALGITLFAITLCLNIYALYIVRKYREQYE
nr:phosphate ABC transporter permease subunit PstC [uncultured Gellertiella sp.]